MTADKQKIILFNIKNTTLRQNLSFEQGLFKLVYLYHAFFHLGQQLYNDERRFVASYSIPGCFFTHCFFRNCFVARSPQAFRADTEE
jgi:hypothetical protein